MVNIAEILKNMPKGTKLYSPICGECELDCLCYDGDIITVVYGGRENANYSASEYEELERNHVLCFDRYGKYESTGETMLFPSNNCRDWEAFKEHMVIQKIKDDIVRGFTEEFKKIIDKMSDEEFEKIFCEIINDDEKISQKIDKYLNFLNRNREFSFKRGDFIYRNPFVYVYCESDTNTIKYFALIDPETDFTDFDLNGKTGIGYKTDSRNQLSRKATEEEKQILLEAIKSNGYVWDDEKLELKRNSYIDKL